MTTDIRFLPAIEPVHSLRTKELTAREVLSAYLA